MYKEILDKYESDLKQNLKQELKQKIEQVSEEVVKNLLKEEIVPVLKARLLDQISLKKEEIVAKLSKEITETTKISVKYKYKLYLFLVKYVDKFYDYMVKRLQ